MCSLERIYKLCLLNTGKSHITFITCHQCPSISQENTYSQELSREDKWKWMPLKFGLLEIWKGVLNKDTRLLKEKSYSCRSFTKIGSVKNFYNIYWKEFATESLQVKFKVFNFQLYQKRTLTHVFPSEIYTFFEPITQKVWGERLDKL